MNIIEEIKTKAERLYELRKLIEDKEEAVKNETLALKEERDAIQALLLIDLRDNGLSSIKVSSGDSFSRGVRKGVEIISEAHALKWAKENDAFSIDKKLVAQKLKDATELPPCFDWSETEFISVRKAKESKSE